MVGRRFPAIYPRTSAMPFVSADLVLLAVAELFVPVLYNTNLFDRSANRLGRPGTSAVSLKDRNQARCGNGPPGFEERPRPISTC